MRVTVNTIILLILAICTVLSSSRSAPVTGTKNIVRTEARKRFVIIDSISRGKGKVDDDDDKKDEENSKAGEQDGNPSKNKRSSSRGAPSKRHRHDGEDDDDDDGDELEKKEMPSKNPVRTQSEEKAKTGKKKKLKKDDDDDDDSKHEAPSKKQHSAHKPKASRMPLPSQEPVVAKKPEATRVPVATEAPHGKSKASSAIGFKNEGSEGDRKDDDDDDDDEGTGNQIPDDPNRLVARSVEDFRELFLKFMRNPNNTYYFVNVYPFRDNFCTEKGVRDVPCLRAVIMDVNTKNFSLDITGTGFVDTFGFVFADSKGVYVSYYSEDDYITVMTPKTDGDNKAIRKFITRQSQSVGAAPHITAKCTENIPLKIKLPGPRTVVPHAKNDCEPRECLSLSVLARVPHVKIASPQAADVLCYRDLCATPAHRVQVHPRSSWITMRKFCGDLHGECTREKHMVAKALLETTEWYGLRFGVVYGEGRAEAAITSAIQFAIDAGADARRRVARIAGAVRVETWRSCLAQ